MESKSGERCPIEQEGAPPRRADAMSFTTTYGSPLGPLTLCSDGEALTALHFGAWKYAREDPEAERRDGLPVFRQTAAWLDGYFAGRNPGPLPELNLQGSDFRRQVWAELGRIPYGKLTTYGAIAAELARRTGGRVSAQAVGGAVGHNPIGILVPCHRVVGSDGSLTGFAAGLDAKIFLLNLEGADFTKLYRPRHGTAL